MALEPMLRAVLNDFYRCSAEKQIEAVQHMALLAAGKAPPPAASPARKAKARPAATGAVKAPVGKRKKSD